MNDDVINDSKNNGEPNEQEKQDNMDYVIPSGIFTITIDDEALERLEEEATPFSPEMDELNEYNVKKVISELKKK